MASRRRVVWSQHSLAALDEILTYIAEDSSQGAASVARAALASAGSLASLAERGRVVPELEKPAIREIFVFRYRLIYEVADEQVTILAFLHGARDFERWRRESGFE